jgi:predicted kinase
MTTFSDEQMHADVIEKELGPDGIEAGMKELKDDDLWMVVASLAGEVWTINQMNRFMELAATFEQTLPTEVKVFQKNYRALELRRKLTYRESVERVVEKERWRRSRVNRGEED